jgi:hypothetical protein
MAEIIPWGFGLTACDQHSSVQQEEVSWWLMGGVQRWRNRILLERTAQLAVIDKILFVRARD